MSRLRAPDSDFVVLANVFMIRAVQEADTDWFLYSSHVPWVGTQNGLWHPFKYGDILKFIRAIHGRARSVAENLVKLRTCQTYTIVKLNLNLWDNLDPVQREGWRALQGTGTRRANIRKGVTKERGNLEEITSFPVIASSAKRNAKGSKGSCRENVFGRRDGLVERRRHRNRDMWSVEAITMATCRASRESRRSLAQLRKHRDGIYEALVHGCFSRVKRKEWRVLEDDGRRRKYGKSITAKARQNRRAQKRGRGWKRGCTGVATWALRCIYTAE